MPAFLDHPTRFLFFTGKGGVGKTALACATALQLADRGRRVLLVSTDPASNLDELLGTRLGEAPTPIAGADRLSAMNIDPEQAAEAYRRRVIDPYRGVWTEPQIAELREQLSGACTTEIAAFDEFSSLLAGDMESVPYDHVIFDTAPTGHTLRLLSLPRAWTTFLATTPQGASCLGPHSGLKMLASRFAAAVAALADPARTTLVLVTRPERSALREAERTSGELDALEIRNQQLVVNGVFHASDRSDTVALALEERGHDALRELPPRLQALPSTEVPLRSFNLVGLPALHAIFDDRVAATLVVPRARAVAPSLMPLRTLIDDLAAPGRGLVLVMGKGGVGKTTIASAIAAELASRGHHVQLSTTDPAAHVAATLAGQLEHLTVSRIDPAVERQAYVDRIMATRGARLDEQGRALLAEDLRSPCYEEVAVFTAFSRIVNQARESFVILDTAPTGHTVLLLDATGSYHRQVLRAGSSHRVITPLMRLRDPQYSKILVVTLAETTPVSEAAWLQEDLRRAQIEPYAWVINESLAATPTTDPCLESRKMAELAQLDRVSRQYARRVAVVPWLLEEPVGPVRLLALARGPGGAMPGPEPYRPGAAG